MHRKCNISSCGLVVCTAEGMELEGQESCGSDAVLELEEMRVIQHDTDARTGDRAPARVILCDSMYFGQCWLVGMRLGMWA